MEKELVLVTGASGYIASHIVEQLLHEGYKVRGTIRSLKDEKKVLPLRSLAKNPHSLELVEANLLDENSWYNAVNGCAFVLHTASPFPSTIPDDENEIIKPAVEGTLNILKACVLTNPIVRRVVLTSSIAAVADLSSSNTKLFDETNWPDLNKIPPYEKSKTLAEKSAWDFVRERQKNNQPCFELAVINPGFVLGPILHDGEGTSMSVMNKLLERQMPLLPNISFGTCDVRQVALAHLRAMLIPEAVNNRHLIISSTKSSSFKDYALILDEEFGKEGYNVPTKVACNCCIKMLALFDKSIKMIVPNLGKCVSFDNKRMIHVLKIEPIPIKKTLIDMAYSMIEKGKIKK